MDVRGRGADRQKTLVIAGGVRSLALRRPFTRRCVIRCRQLSPELPHHIAFAALQVRHGLVHPIRARRVQQEMSVCGLKAHIGVDMTSGLVHTVVAKSGNVADINVAAALLHGDEEVAFGDAGYQGIHKRSEVPSGF